MSSGGDQAYPFVFSADSPLLGVYRTLERVRETATTILIEGESGTGKDAVAQWLHYNSPRKDAPCIKIDFSSLPEDLVESELFGYERGAFTGAVSSKLGKLDLAQGGTAILDEIGNIDLTIQAKLLQRRGGEAVLPARRNEVHRTRLAHRSALQYPAGPGCRPASVPSGLVLPFEFDHHSRSSSSGEAERTV